MLLKDKIVAIVGAGPGGLTLATLLQQKGINIQIYERDADKDARQQGTTLDLHEDSGLKALRIAGLMDEFKKRYRPGADKMRITDKEGNILFDDHTVKSEEDFGSIHFRPEIDRGPLRHMLIESLQPGTIQWNARFTGMNPKDAGWELHFDNHPSAYADLVVAADGANSKLRKYITDIQPIYSDITMVEGNIHQAESNAPKLWELVKGGKIFALGSEKTLILGAKGDGTLSFATGVKEPESWAKHSNIDFASREQVRDWFMATFADWGQAWHELFFSDDAWYIPRPMYHFPLDQRWSSKPNLTMIGDAAHRMPPYAGEGVNQAMQDALELYEALCLQAHKTIPDAIESFEKVMCERAGKITDESLRSTEMMHAPDGLDNLLRFFNREGDVL